MIRVWGKIIRGHRIIKSTTVSHSDQKQPLLIRVKECLDRIVMDLDLPRPIWLKQNEQDILEFGRTEFHQDHFLEPVSFHHLEIEIIETEE